MHDLQRQFIIYPHYVIIVGYLDHLYYFYYAMLVGPYEAVLVPMLVHHVRVEHSYDVVSDAQVYVLCAAHVILFIFQFDNVDGHD